MRQYFSDILLKNTIWVASFILQSSFFGDRVSFMHTTPAFNASISEIAAHRDSSECTRLRTHLYCPPCTKRVMSLSRGERWSKWKENRENMTMLTWKGGLSNSGETWKTLSPPLSLLCFLLYLSISPPPPSLPRPPSLSHNCTFRLKLWMLTRLLATLN